jgi:ectoine hydroxylase-related dioxygenase (phytanoyl-CoA dioxygenase family)
MTHSLHAHPLRRIDEVEINEYEQAGVVHLPGMFDGEWLDLLRAGVDECMAAPGPHAVIGNRALPGFFFGDQDMWWRADAFRRLVLESPAVEIAATIMRASRVNFFFDQVIVKEPGTEQRTPWHQDQPYWAVRGRQVCSVWLALDAVARANCVEFIAGSHRWNIEFNPQHFADGSGYAGTGLPALPDIEAGRDGYPIVSFDVQAGDCIAFNAMTVHGAPGNRSLESRRRAVSTRWCGDDARYLVRPGEVAVPSRDPGLCDGDILDCDLFPRLWPRVHS